MNIPAALLVVGTATVEGNKVGVNGTLAADGSFAGRVTLPQR